MKKNFVITAAVLLLALTASGCKSKETRIEPAATQQQGQQTAEAAATAAPANPTSEPAAPAVTETPAAGELVEMQAVSQENAIQNVVGVKTQTSSSVIVMNQTGGIISEFFVRLHPSDDDEEVEWGDDLIQTSFTLATGDKMLYYYEKGVGGAMYDLRVAYTDPIRSECYFRNIPLETISQITLRMDGEDEDSIPYATYMTTGTTREYSTLNEVKQRLGLLDNDDEDEDEYSEMSETVQYTPVPTQTPEPEEYIDTGEISGDSNPQTDTMTTAQSYIGQSLASLEGAIGSPNGSDYEEEPELGNTGYHYYGSFTVSTSVDENGNEIVTGIW